MNSCLVYIVFLIKCKGSGKGWRRYIREFKLKFEFSGKGFNIVFRRSFVCNNMGYLGVCIYLILDVLCWLVILIKKLIGI